MMSASWQNRRSVLISNCVFVLGCGGSDDVSPGPSPPVPPASPPPPLPPTPPPNPPPVVRIDLDFSAGPNWWSAHYSDYILGQESRIAFESRFAQLPPPLAPAGGYLLSSVNEFWMFFFSRDIRTRSQSILSVGHRHQYRRKWRPQLRGHWGIALRKRYSQCGQETQVERGNYVAVNFDKGVQTIASPNVPVIGDFSNSSLICTDTRYGKNASDVSYRRYFEVKCKRFTLA